MRGQPKTSFLIGIKQAQSESRQAPDIHVMRMQFQFFRNACGRSVRLLGQRFEQTEINADVDQKDRVEAASPGEDLCDLLVDRYI